MSTNPKILSTLPQVAEMNTHRLVDAAGECFVYDELAYALHHAGRFQI